MKKYFFLIPLFLLFYSCLSDKNIILSHKVTSITIDTLLNEKISCRAILIDKNKVWFTANEGKYGYVSLDSTPYFKGLIEKEEIKLEFRSIAQNSKYIFILSIGNPALLYRISKEGSVVKLVYQENNEKVFYDSMQFLNDNEGFAIGDPTENCPSFIKTTNGGESWQKTSCDDLPKFVPGEAFFATSNSNLILKDNTIWMASGGIKSKIYRSVDKGKMWETFETPIVQGGAMTGIFTADFYDRDNGFITGGNYQLPDSNFKNKAITSNGGKTWKLIDDNRVFGYASCVQYFPNSGGKSIVVIANSGIFYYTLKDKKWKKLSDVNDLYTIRFIDERTAVAAGKNKILKITFN